MSNLSPELVEELRDLIRSLLFIHEKQGFIFSDSQTDLIMGVIGEYVHVYRSPNFVGLKVFTLIDSKKNRKDLQEILKMLEV